MQAGAIVAGRFAIERVAGSGGMGTVYRAIDRTTGEPVALKVLQRSGAAHAERFEREARLLAELRHPRIVRYVAHGIAEGGEQYLAMEWLEGEDLEQRIARAPLTIQESVAVAAAAVEALAVAHARGIVHRDIKPSNLFLPERRIDRLKVLDFGIARINLATRAMTRTGTTLGTPGYMAPEQARGDKEVDARADVFAIGGVLFECLTGRPPFVGEHMMAVLAKVLLEDAPRVRELRKDVSAELDLLVSRMLAKSPSARPADAAAVGRELAALHDVGGEAPLRPSIKSPALGKREQRLVSVVLAQPLREPRADWSAATMTPEEANRTRETVLGALVAFGAKLEWLADGSIVATLAGKGTAATDQAARAARCALAMRSALQGAAMALATGRGDVSDRLPVGEVIDRAARLLAASTADDSDQGGGTGARPIRIDEVTAGLLDLRFDVGGDGKGLALRGEREVVETTRTLLGKPTSCVGRERELSVLDGIFAECLADGVARAVLVTAPAGVGKTRLGHEFLRKARAAHEDVEVWIARGDPLGAGSPFALLAQAIRRAAGLLDGEPLAIRQKKLRARVARHVPVSDQRRVAEFLGEIVGTPFPEGESVQLSAARQNAMLMGDQMRRAWEDFVVAECAARPVILVLEDLQWGDVPTIKFVDAALRKLVDHPFMAIAFARPEVQQLFPNLWAGRPVTQIQLGELSRKACERLARQVLGEDVAPDVLARLVERAAGNAFYLEELIRAVAEGKGNALPETVLAMVQARLEELDPEARRVLRAAAVFGQVFWQGGIEELLGGDAEAAAAHDWLSELAEKELVERRGEGRFPGQQEYAFRHALVREAAYAMLTDKDRALGNALAGAWLEKRGESDAMVLAEHFERGAEPARAAAWYARAAEQALEANDFDGTVARAERGIACGASGELLGALRAHLAEARVWKGDWALAEENGLAAMELLPHGSPSWCEAAGFAAWAAGTVSHNERLCAIAEQLYVLGKDALDRHRVIAMVRAVARLLFTGDYELADRLVALADRAKDDPTVAGALYDVRSRRALSDPASIAELSGRAAKAFEAAGNVRDASLMYIHVGYAYIELGAYAEAERALHEALASAERLGVLSSVYVAKHNLGLAIAHLGRLEEALRIEREAVDAFIEKKDHRLEGGSRIYVARILVRMGDLEEAEKEARLSLEATRSQPPLHCDALATLAGVLLVRGRPAEALEFARQANDVLVSLGAIEEGESLVRLTYPLCLDENGQHDAARAAIAVARDALVARAERIHDPAWRKSFLENVPENARTMRLASEWGV